MIAADPGTGLSRNFNENGIRDLSAVESVSAAAKALYAMEPAGTTSPDSAFDVTSDAANTPNSTPVTCIDVKSGSHTVTKGNLIVTGDYLTGGHEGHPPSNCFPLTKQLSCLFVD